MEFDEKTQQQLSYYVYILVDPCDMQPFYIGKGKNNRVFDHIKGALKDTSKDSLKYDIIRQIQAKDKQPFHYIVRHGLSEKEAFTLEASLIDLLSFMHYKKTNRTGGHNSAEKGMMTADELMRIYNAQELQPSSILEGTVAININRKYKRGFTKDSISEVTRESWVIAKKKLPTIKYVLSEYRGLVVGVFEVYGWYPVTVTQESGKNKGKTKTRYGFYYHDKSNSDIGRRYMNHSIAHYKKRGEASPVIYLYGRMPQQ